MVQKKQQGGSVYLPNPNAFVAPIQGVNPATQQYTLNTKPVDVTQFIQVLQNKDRMDLQQSLIDLRYEQMKVAKDREKRLLQKDLFTMMKTEYDEFTDQFGIDPTAERFQDSYNRVTKRYNQAMQESMIAASNGDSDKAFRAVAKLESDLASDKEYMQYASMESAAKDFMTKADEIRKKGGGIDEEAVLDRMHRYRKYKNGELDDFNINEFNLSDITYNKTAVDEFLKSVQTAASQGQTKIEIVGDDPNNWVERTTIEYRDPKELAQGVIDYGMRDPNMRKYLNSQFGDMDDDENYQRALESFEGTYDITINPDSVSERIVRGKTDADRDRERGWSVSGSNGTSTKDKVSLYKDVYGDDGIKGAMIADALGLDPINNPEVANLINKNNGIWNNQKYQELKRMSPNFKKKVEQTRENISGIAPTGDYVPTDFDLIRQSEQDPNKGILSVGDENLKGGNAYGSLQFFGSTWNEFAKWLNKKGYVDISETGFKNLDATNKENKDKIIGFISSIDGTSNLPSYEELETMFAMETKWEPAIKEFEKALGRKVDKRVGVFLADTAHNHGGYKKIFNRAMKVLNEDETLSKENDLDVLLALADERRYYLAEDVRKLGELTEKDINSVMNRIMTNEEVLGGNLPAESPSPTGPVQTEVIKQEPADTKQGLPDYLSN